MLPFCQPPRCIPLSPSPREAPSQQVQVGGQRRSSHRHLGAHQEESREGRKEGWLGGSKGGRQAGGRRRQGGEREGRRRDANKEPRSWGWQGVQGRGCRSRGSGGTWGRGRGLGGRIVQPAPDLPSLQWGWRGGHPQGREVCSSELRTARMEGRQEQGLWGNMGKKLLTAHHPLPSPSDAPHCRPELFPGALASPSPNTPWTRKQSHPSIAGIETPPFVVGVSQSRSPGFGSILPFKVCLAEQGGGAELDCWPSLPPPTLPEDLTPSELRGCSRGRHAQCPRLPGHLSRTWSSTGPGTILLQPGIKPQLQQPLGLG